MGYLGGDLNSHPYSIFTDESWWYPLLNSPTTLNNPFIVRESPHNVCPNLLFFLDRCAPDYG